MRSDRKMVPSIFQLSSPVFLKHNLFTVITLFTLVTPAHTTYVRESFGSLSTLEINITMPHTVRTCNLKVSNVTA